MYTSVNAVYTSVNGPGSLLLLTEMENRGLSAGNAPKTDTDVAAVGHQEPVTFTATVAAWIGRMSKEKYVPRVTIITVPQTIQNHIKHSILSGTRE